MKVPVLLLLGLVLLLVIGYLLFVKPSAQTKVESPVMSTEATLSDRLEFPAGYHLADAYSYAFQYTGPYVVYICQRDDDPTDYRICTPKVTKDGAS